MPMDIGEVEKDPELVRPYYADIEQTYMPGKDSITTDQMVEIYGKKGNQTLPAGVSGYVGWKKYYLERFSYAAIKILPILLILPGAYRWFRRHRSS